MSFPPVQAGKNLVFPHDHGAHPEFRTEWWYLTGWLVTTRGQELGFQVTFFRTRPPYDFATPGGGASENPSAFTPRQLLLAHAALADPLHGRLRHSERAARASLGVAGAAVGNTDVWIDNWRLQLVDQRYRAVARGRDFGLDLGIAAPRAPLLQGVKGFSRKGPRDSEASYYYSRPGLKVSGSIERGAGMEAVSGTGWLDHEWSSEYMAAGASGWDWIGISLEDGGALMAFRMRAKDGSTLYAGGTYMRANGANEAFEPDDVEFKPLRTWRSPRSGTTYPVALQVRTKGMHWQIEPLLEDQELDARASTATIYWEGAVRVQRDGVPVGKGYLELTGYWRPMRL